MTFSISCRKYMISSSKSLGLKSVMERILASPFLPCYFLVRVVHVGTLFTQMIHGLAFCWLLIVSTSCLCMVTTLTFPASTSSQELLSLWKYLELPCTSGYVSFSYATFFPILTITFITFYCKFWDTDGLYGLWKERTHTVNIWINFMT